MTLPAVSVVVVSHGRPDTLSLCLTGLSWLDYPNYEVIVVADTPGLAAVQDMGLSDQVKLVTFDTANISAARNLGIAQAAGDIIAFIDDDAVPEPTWLRHLMRGFDLPGVAAAGGYVIGRNGISFQWRARSIDRCGVAHDLNVVGDDPVVPDVPECHAVKTEGTNMAVRADVLRALGGFDPAFRFYLDESDLNMQLAQAGHGTAIVPLAQVHHAYAPSLRRGADRRVRDLTEIGASQVVFLRKHCPKAQHDVACDVFCFHQRNRLIDQMVKGLSEPRDIARIMSGLKAGLADGKTRDIPALPTLSAGQSFRQFESRHKGKSDVLSGRIWQRQSLAHRATSLAKQGVSVTVYEMSPTALYHRAQFHRDGYWVQQGGLWGRSDRAGPLIAWTGFAARVRAEIARVYDVRQGCKRVKKDATD